jgi:hypothetical protein
MKHKYIIGLGISAFLLFYFLFPVVEIDMWCHSKESKSDLPEGSIGILMKTSMFTYTIYLLNGGQLEHDGKICTSRG